MLLLASAILLVRPYLTPQWIERHYISVCIAVGLFASTRLITLLPVILLLFPYYLRLSPRRMILSPIIIRDIQNIDNRLFGNIIDNM